MGAACAYGVAVDGRRAVVWCSDHFTLKASEAPRMRSRAGRAAKRQIGGRVFVATTTHEERHERMRRLEGAFRASGYEVETRRIESKGDRRQAQFEAGYRKWHEGREAPC